MTCTLDGQSLFEETVAITVGSSTRRFVERSIAGLDGLLSIDLGAGAGKITQMSKIRAVSELAIAERLAAISAFIDGRLHQLVSENGEVFENLRVDSVIVKDKRLTGSGIEVVLEVVYKQLL